MVSMTTKSQNQLKLLNLVTMATKKNGKRVDLMLNKEGDNKNIRFWKTIYESWGFHEFGNHGNQK